MGYFDCNNKWKSCANVIINYIFDNLDLDENFQNCLRLLIAYGTIFIFTRDNPVVINFEFTDYIKLTQVGAYPRTN